MGDYTVKDSGKRQSFDSGMVRDVTEAKTNWALVFDGPMLRRWAEHLTKGAQKYSPRNWMKAAGEEEKQRFKESAIRHFCQWVNGEKDEDHAAATIFNMNGYEYVDQKTKEHQREEEHKELGHKIGFYEAFPQYPLGDELSAWKREQIERFRRYWP